MALNEGLKEAAENFQAHSLKRAAADFMAAVKTARVAPFMSEELHRGLAELHKQIEQAIKTTEAVGKVANDAYDKAVDLDDTKQRAFVEQGNHEDDWNSTEEGWALEQAVKLTEGFHYQEVDRGNKQAIIRNLIEAKNGVELYLRWIEKGKY